MVTERKRSREAVTDLAAALRYALQTGHFETSSVLAEQFREAVACALRSAPSPEERAAIAKETISFLEDRLHLARVVRAHLASQLANASRAHSYVSPQSAAERTWLLEA